MFRSRGTAARKGQGRKRDADEHEAQRRNHAGGPWSCGSTRSGGVAGRVEAAARRETAYDIDMGPSSAASTMRTPPISSTSCAAQGDHRPLRSHHPAEDQPAEAVRIAERRSRRSSRYYKKISGACALRALSQHCGKQRLGWASLPVPCTLNRRELLPTAQGLLPVPDEREPLERERSSDRQLSASRPRSVSGRRLNSSGMFGRPAGQYSPLLRHDILDRVTVGTASCGAPLHAAPHHGVPWPGFCAGYTSRPVGAFKIDPGRSRFRAAALPALDKQALAAVLGPAVGDARCQGGHLREG